MKPLALLLCLLPAFAAAQEPVITDSDTPITVEVTRVNLLFTVTDARGRFMTDLKKDDFEITENKKKQNILEFTAESDLPHQRHAVLGVAARLEGEREAATGASHIADVHRAIPRAVGCQPLQHDGSGCELGRLKGLLRCSSDLHGGAWLQRCGRSAQHQLRPLEQD